MTVPARPKLFHITHVDNLRPILADGGLLPDAVLIARNANVAGIGMASIKQRRLTLPVRCHPGDQVGDCVPFYFCPRSIMLYLIHCKNHPELTYRGGQEPIVHLELDLQDVATWADANGRRWAFTLSNAGAHYAEFRSRVDQLGEIDWAAVGSTDFRSQTVKEGKQAEFLVHGFVPWELVARIGVHSAATAAQAAGAISSAGHQPPIDVLPGWYY
jgi:hypothetical protein